MKKVLWISRHEMTPEQLADLERICGEPVNLLRSTETVTRIDSLAGAAAEADLLAAVLPLPLMAELLVLAAGKPVLQSVSRRRATGTRRTLPDGSTEPEFAFYHDYWQQILRLELETRRL